MMGGPLVCPFTVKEIRNKNEKYGFNGFIKNPICKGCNGGDEAS